MAIETKLHLERLGSRHQRHPIDPSVATHASHALGDMRRVIEIDVIRQPRYPVPLQRLVVGQAFANRREHCRTCPDLRMAAHADMSGWQARLRARFDRCVTIPAINAEAGHMMFMTEWNWLVLHPSNQRPITGVGVTPDESYKKYGQYHCRQKNGAEPRIGRCRENLGQMDTPRRRLKTRRRAESSAGVCKIIFSGCLSKMRKSLYRRLAYRQQFVCLAQHSRERRHG